MNNISQVSVILITHNGATRGYLLEAIKSVVNQTHPSIELLIVDDGSTDGTKEICEPYLSLPWVTYHYQENQGPSAARNAGLKLATSNYICFLDDDDLYEPHMIETLLEFWKNQADPDCGLVYGPVREIDSSGAYIRDKFVKKNGDIYEDLLWGNFISCPSALMIKKSVFEKVGSFRQDILYCEDYELWLRIAKNYKILTVDVFLAKYRIHTNKLSHHFSKMQEYHKRVLDENFQNAPAIIQEKRSHIYHYFYECCAAQYLGHEMIQDFRRQYRQGKAYGRHKLSWKMKYVMSYIPGAFSFLSFLRE